MPSAIYEDENTKDEIKNKVLKSMRFSLKNNILEVFKFNGVTVEKTTKRDAKIISLRKTLDEIEEDDYLSNSVSMLNQLTKEISGNSFNFYLSFPFMVNYQFKTRQSLYYNKSDYMMNYRMLYDSYNEDAELKELSYKPITELMDNIYKLPKADREYVGRLLSMDGRFGQGSSLILTKNKTNLIEQEVNFEMNEFIKSDIVLDDMKNSID